MKKEPKDNGTDNSGNLEPLTTSEAILDEMTKKFIIKGKPLRVRSRHNEKYDWIKTPSTFKTKLEMIRFVTDFVAYEMPEIQKQFTFKTIDNVWNGILDMLDTNNGRTTNGFKGRVVKDPRNFINFERKKESLSIEEATSELLEKYDVDLAGDGSFLVITNRKNNEAEDPTGGLGPIYRVTQIIEHELVYGQPECELIIGVVHNLFEIAKKKEMKPYVHPDYIENMNNDSESNNHGKEQ